MPITPKPSLKTWVTDTSTPFLVTLAVTDTAEDVAAVPGGKVGRTISLVNEGPGDVVLAFDATATTGDLIIREGEAYDETALELATNVSFINLVTGATPTVRGVLWSGD